MQTGIFLINLGTPLSFRKKDVARYLKEFLLDKRVIDLPFIKRELLVRSIIVPFRSASSAKAYKQIWTEKGSPLMFHTQELTENLQKEVGEDFVVRFAMRYQVPSIESELEKLKNMNLKKIIILPLFPQYASATTGSIIEKIFTEIKTWQTFPNIKIINSFYDHPLFIKTWAKKAREENYKEYDHLLISFHGLPESQLKKADTQKICLTKKNCCSTICSKNASCYGAQCYRTAQLIADELGLSPSNYSISFQSRLGKTPWIQPYTSDVIKNLSSKGIKKVLVISPAFVCDCLETIFEIEVEYQHEFKAQGGDKLKLVAGLNTDQEWVNALKEIVMS